MRTLVLIDAHNWLHRFHHAMPPQVYRGRNVAAVRGLRDLAGRLARQFRPASVLAVFDGGHAHRSELLPGYKAARPDTPPELHYQIELAREYLPRLGTSTARVEGFEADDVIAALVGRVRAAGSGGIAAQIVSGDKDLCALVDDEDPRVSIHNRRVDGWVTWGSAEVQGRLGVPPPLVLDLLALAGDGGDGVPGVPGIGPKTAAELLLRFGSLEQLLARREEVARERLRTLLREHEAAVRLCRRVVAFAPLPLAAIDSQTWTADAGKEAS